MRQILFRGKRLDNGEWVEGNLNITYYGGAYISAFEATYMAVFDSVDPVTIGQYTGLNDKNQNFIFEGDIIAWPDAPDHPHSVVWKDDRWMLKRRKAHSSLLDIEGAEVIGNIHDKEQPCEKP